MKKTTINEFILKNSSSWNAGVGPTKDAYTIGDNPQFNLRVGAGQGSVWVLLTRHITSIEDFRENHEYITLLVYQNGGKRIYYPCKPFNRDREGGEKQFCVGNHPNRSNFQFQTIHHHLLMAFESTVRITYVKFV